MHLFRLFFRFNFGDLKTGLKTILSWSGTYINWVDIILGKYFMKCKLAAVGLEDICSSRLNSNGTRWDGKQFRRWPTSRFRYSNGFRSKAQDIFVKKLWIVQHAMYIQNSIIRLNHFLELKNFPTTETPSIHCFLYIAWVGTGQV